jgi:hypothetical protein
MGRCAQQICPCESLKKTDQELLLEKEWLYGFLQTGRYRAEH